MAAATDFTWPDAVITREALRTRAAKTRLFIVVLTLFWDLLANDSAGAFSFNATEQVAPPLLNNQQADFLRRM